MHIIISPAKKMREETDTLPPESVPVFLARAEQIRARLQQMSRKELQALWGCNEKLTELNAGRLARMELRRGLTPAILAYEGIQYQYMASNVLEGEEYAYLQKHLRILSGLYGVLRPFDGIVPYRLEMQAKLEVGGAADLYHFWKDAIYREVMEMDQVVVNLASKEYSKCVESYRRPGDRMVTVVFGEMAGDRIVQKGTLAKMARGEMVRFMAQRRMQSPEEMKAFRGLGYRFAPEHSSLERYVFLK